MKPDSTIEIEVEGQRTRLLETGEGPTVVLLHGWGGRIESMAPVVNCLAPAFRVLALDLPGFGDSPLPAGAWGTSDYASFVEAVLARRGVERAHFVGHSYGAKTSLYLAATRADLVEKLVLAGSSGLRIPPSLGARARRGLSKLGRVAGHLGPPGRAVKKALYARIASQDYKEAGGLRPILVKVVNEDLTDLLPRVQAPTLLIWGDGDDAVPLSHARKMESMIPDAGLVVLDGAGHFSYIDQTARFCRVARHFLGAPL